MNRTGMSVDAVVKRIVAEQTGLPFHTITPAAKLYDDLGADSLDRVEIVMAIECDFAIQIPDEEADKFDRDDATVGELINFVEGKV